MGWCGSGWVQVESSCEFGDEHSGLHKMLAGKLSSGLAPLL
jgi:hypothetical protein